MLKIKPGVSIRGLRPEIVFAALIVAGVFAKSGVEPVWITSGTEGKHSAGSLHYVGAALDIRLPPPALTSDILNRLRESLGAEFDVVLESSHIHIEFQPKTPLNQS